MVALFFSLLLLAQLAQGLPSESVDEPCGKSHAKVSAGAAAFLREYSAGAEIHSQNAVKARWLYSTEPSEDHAQTKLETEFKAAEFTKSFWDHAKLFSVSCVTEPEVRSQFQKLSVIGLSALDEETFKKISSLFAEMLQNIEKGSRCQHSDKNSNKQNCNLADVERVFSTSTNEDELLQSWLFWRRTVGKSNRELFPQIIPYLNEAANLNGFKDWGKLWQAQYEIEGSSLETQVELLWSTLQPLYKQLHAYVRRQAINKYGKDKLKADGAIPAHLLGSPFATNWRNIAKFALPFPGKESLNTTRILKDQGFTPIRMIKLAESSYTSMGLESMTKEFWEKSVFEKQDNETVTNCRPSAWDFCDGTDFRIKLCNGLNHMDLTSAIREIGKVECFMGYRDQPYLFREPANPAFPEAVGGAIALSTINIKHLKRVGLLENDADDTEININFLFGQALDIVPSLPFHLLVDLWRWKLFEGQIESDELNRFWWELRLQYQGIKSPVPVTENDFELGSFYNAVTPTEFISNFLSKILQFQIYEGLCKASGHKGPLHECDIYGSNEAGKMLKEALSLGSSRSWPELMRILTGGATEQIDARSLLEYFRPLHHWLQEANRYEYLGWKI